MSITNTNGDTNLQTEDVPLHHFITTRHGAQAFSSQQTIPRRHVMIGLDRNTSLACVCEKKALLLFCASFTINRAQCAQNVTTEKKKITLILLIRTVQTNTFQLGFGKLHSYCALPRSVYSNPIACSLRYNNSLKLKLFV